MEESIIEQNFECCEEGTDCFNEGTKILCVMPSGEKSYIPIQDLKPGMHVETYKNGAVPIESIGKVTKPNESYSLTNCMYKLPRKDDMIDDLIVTGGHSILVDKDVITPEQKLVQIKKYKLNFSIEEKKGLMACVSDDFIKLTDPKPFTIYNFALVSKGGEIRYGVYANGVLCETPSSKQIRSITFDSFETH